MNQVDNIIMQLEGVNCEQTISDSSKSTIQQFTQPNAVVKPSPRVSRTKYLNLVCATHEQAAKHGMEKIQVTVEAKLVHKFNENLVGAA